MAKTTEERKSVTAKIVDSLTLKVNKLTEQNRDLKKWRKEAHHQKERFFVQANRQEEVLETVTSDAKKKTDALSHGIVVTRIRLTVSALIITIVSLSFLFFVAFTQHDISPISIVLLASICFIIASVGSIFRYNDGDDLSVAVLAGIILGVVGSFITSAHHSFNSWYFCVLYIAFGIIFLLAIVYSAREEEKQERKKCSHLIGILLSLIFPIITISGILPLSKYHNLNQIERDKGIVEKIQLITTDPNGLSILLPEEYISENRYMEEVLCFQWSGFKKKYPWKKILIPCKRGDAKWYEAFVPFPEDPNDLVLAQVTLLFDHALKDFSATLQIP